MDTSIELYVLDIEIGAYGQNWASSVWMRILELKVWTEVLSYMCWT